MKHGATIESLVFLFLLGLLLFNAPVLSIFNVPDYVLGIPVLYLYLFTVWAALIALMALTIENAATRREARDSGEEPILKDQRD